MRKVSIIVPIYNEEKNLKRCVASLINQTYNNLEIILLNDGSTDGTKKIMDSFKDKRIIAIHKTNSGIGDTRNQGIEKSSGDYIMFVDSDDYLELNAVDILVKKIEADEVDLVVCNYYLDTPLKTFEIIIQNLGITSIKEDNDLLTKINLGPCNKIYKASLFKTNRFPVNIKYEDVPVVVNAIVNAKKISFTDELLSHYVIKNTGETITRDERIFDILKICFIIEDNLKDVNYVNKTNLFVKLLMYYLKNSGYLTNKDLRNNFINETYNFLNHIDKNWRKCSYLNRESKIKKFVITHKYVLKIVNKIKKA